MERPGFTKVSMNRCEKLRWKGLYIEALEDPSIPPNNERSFWCQHTFTCLGPDGKVVDEFECSPARTCYEQL
ncbi:MAG TPA: hypothetical protein VMJ75_22460 [Candidatus Acidoferrales bacterium]|nr:hypothetical protein [Candidatus Acidoferrales bacterium]HXK02258.1 hypothetical protein [Verrucomicrobiae bacterium]